eukprot:TRINITY_DN8773_c0_g3_i4.p2 TRINITY_DN8773_c0_g3~~TRINITY_DN8773_c0_g3_i4.p2  ORF type:complete len:125 (+),score=16.61 TRINITY_DN8773_c0_g3_i4:47-421(+)
MCIRDRYGGGEREKKKKRKKRKRSMSSNSTEAQKTMLANPFLKKGGESGESTDTPPDFMSVLSLMFGMVGLLTRYRIFALNSLVCFVMWLANMRTADLDVKQIISSSSVVLLGLVMAYKRDFGW